MPNFPSSFTSIDSWTSVVRKLTGELAAIPKEATNDVRFAELLLELGHARRVAPVMILWEDAKAGRLDRVLSACELLPEPKRWIFLSALAAHFADAGDSSSFDRVWPLVTRFATIAEGAGSLPNASLARCAAFRPALILEMYRVCPFNAQMAFRILARTASAEIVAAVFGSVEKSDLQVRLESELGCPIAWGGRTELVAACLPLIERSITTRYEGQQPVVTLPSMRRDAIRRSAVKAFCSMRHFDDALALLATYENSEDTAYETVITYLEMGEPLKARDVLLSVDEEQTIIVYHPVCFALAEAGYTDAVFEVAEVARRFESRSYAAGLVRDACERAIKKGHADAVAAVLPRITPPRNREKLEALIARAANKAEPKSVRARAELWVEWNPRRMPEAIELIQAALAEGKEKDRAFLLGSLLRAQAKAGLAAELKQTLKMAAEEVGRIKNRERRLDATADVAAAMLAVGRRDLALHLMDTTGGALPMKDEDEARDLVCRFVQACDSIHATHLLANLTRKELEDSGLGLFIEEHLASQDAQTGEVDQLVARAKKAGDFRNVLESLRVDRRFAEAAAVLRHAPNPDAGTTLLEEAAEFRKNAVVLDILQTMNWPIPGEHAPGTTVQTLTASYVFRSTYGLPGGTMEHLLHVLVEPFDFAPREFLESAESFASSGKFTPIGTGVYCDGESMVKGRGSWEAARAHVAAMPKEEGAFPSRLLLSLARIAMRDGRPVADVTSALAECCERLNLFEQGFHEAREILTQLAQIQMNGLPIPGVEDKARTFLDFRGNAFTAHRIHLHALFGEWEKALRLLPLMCSWMERGPTGPYQPCYPWRILQWIPLAQLRLLAADVVQDLPAAWMFVATLAARSEVQTGKESPRRNELVALLQCSIASVHPPLPKEKHSPHFDAILMAFEAEMESRGIKTSND